MVNGDNGSENADHCVCGTDSTNGAAEQKGLQMKRPSSLQSNVGNRAKGHLPATFAQAS